MTHHT